MKIQIGKAFTSIKARQTVTVVISVLDIQVIGENIRKSDKKLETL